MRIEGKIVFKKGQKVEQKILEKLKPTNLKLPFTATNWKSKANYNLVKDGKPFETSTANTETKTKKSKR